MYKTHQKCKTNEIETPKVHQKHLQVLNDGNLQDY